MLKILISSVEIKKKKSNHFNHHAPVSTAERARRVVKIQVRKESGDVVSLIKETEMGEKAPDSAQPHPPHLDRSLNQTQS